MNKLNNETLDNISLKEDINYKEFYLDKDNIKYICILKSISNKIKILIDNYEIELELNEIKNLIFGDKQIHSINKIFSTLIELFEKDKVIIKEINANKNIILIFKLEFINNIIEEKEIILIHKKENKDYIINCLNQDICKLKQEISSIYNRNGLLSQKVKNQNQTKNNNVIDKSLSFSLNDKNSLNYSPIYIQFEKNITTDSYAHFGLDNTFILVQSISSISYIIYSNKSKSIIAQNIINFQKISEIKNAHEEYITNFRHFFDKKNIRDIIMSISAEDNNIKLWDLKNWNCILDLKKINNFGSLFSACFIHDEIENKNMIITSNDNYSNSEKIKIFDFNGNKIKELNGSNHRTYFIDTFYDLYKKEYFIVTGIEKGIISYNYKDSKLYHEYFEGNDDIFLNDHDCVIIIHDKGITKMFESCEDGCIRIWDFHSVKLLNKIIVSENKLYGLCLWNKDFIFVGCDDNTLKLIDLKKNFVINNIKTEGLIVNTKKMNHAIYKECLITQDWKNQIKLWIIKN